MAGGSSLVMLPGEIQVDIVSILSDLTLFPTQETIPELGDYWQWNREDFVRLGSMRNHAQCQNAVYNLAITCRAMYRACLPFLQRDAIATGPQELRETIRKLIDFRNGPQLIPPRALIIDFSQTKGADMDAFPFTKPADGDLTHLTQLNTVAIHAPADRNVFRYIEKTMESVSKLPALERLIVHHPLSSGLIRLCLPQLPALKELYTFLGGVGPQSQQLRWAYYCETQGWLVFSWARQLLTSANVCLEDKATLGRTLVQVSTVHGLATRHQKISSRQLLPRILGFSTWQHTTYTGERHSLSYLFGGGNLESAPATMETLQIIPSWTSFPSDTEQPGRPSSSSFQVVGMDDEDCGGDGVDGSSSSSKDAADAAEQRPWPDQKLRHLTNDEQADRRALEFLVILLYAEHLMAARRDGTTPPRAGDDQDDGTTGRRFQHWRLLDMTAYGADVMGSDRAFENATCAASRLTRPLLLNCGLRLLLPPGMKLVAEVGRKGKLATTITTTTTTGPDFATPLDVEKWPLETFQLLAAECEWSGP